MSTPDPKPSAMKEGYEFLDQPIPWKWILLYALFYSLLMCGVYWLIAFSGHDGPFSDGWIINFLFWFISTVGLAVASWLVFRYAYRQKK